MSELNKIRNHCWRKSITLTILLVLSLVIIAIHYSVNLWALDKGYISSDEGWYMYLFDHQIINTGSHGHILFGRLTVLQDIYLNRLVIYVLKLLSVLCFCFGLNKYLKTRLNYHSSFFILWGLYLLTNLSVASCSTINYTQLIHIIAPFALGLIFLGFVYNKWWLFSISGIFLSLYFPVKITSCIIIPFILFFILLINNYKHVFWCILGIIIGLALDIFVIESPKQIYEWITSVYTSIYNNSTSSHSGSSLLIWLKNTWLYVIRWSIIAFIFIAIRHYMWTFGCLKNHMYVRATVFTAIILLLFIYSWYYITPLTRPTSANSLLKNLVWISAIMTGAYYLTLLKDIRTFLVICLMLISTVCICFGTDVDFIINHSASYISVILIFSFVMPGKFGFGFRITGIISMVCAIFFFVHSPLRNWHLDYYNEQTVPLKTIGINQSISLDKKYIDRIVFIKDNVPSNSNVIISPDNWGPIELLGLNAIDPYIFNVVDQIERIKHNIDIYSGKGDIYLIFEYGRDDNQNVWYDMVNELNKCYDIELIQNELTSIVHIKTT